MSHQFRSNLNYNDKKNSTLNHPKCYVNKNNNSIETTSNSALSYTISSESPSIDGNDIDNNLMKHHHRVKENDSRDSGLNLQCNGGNGNNPLISHQSSTFYDALSGSENINAISNRIPREDDLVSNGKNFNFPGSLSRPFDFDNSTESSLEKYYSQFSQYSPLPGDNHHEETTVPGIIPRSQEIGAGGFDSTGGPSLNSFYDLSSSEVNLDNLTNFLFRGDQIPQQNAAVLDNTSSHVTKTGKVTRKISKSTLKGDSGSTTSKSCKKKDIRPSPIWSYPLTIGSGRCEGGNASSAGGVGVYKNSINGKHEDIVNDQKAFAAHFNQKLFTRNIVVENTKLKKEKGSNDSGNHHITGAVAIQVPSFLENGKQKAMEQISVMNKSKKKASSSSSTTSNNNNKNNNNKKKTHKFTHAFLEQPQPQPLHPCSKTTNLKNSSDNMSVSTCSNGSKGGEKKGFWTAEEDEIIILCIKEGMNKWSDIAERIPGRIGKQCRERWFNHLDPNLKKGGWTLDEDEILVQAQARWGNSWTKIARLLPGRSENAVKNRWNSASRRRTFPHAPLWSQRKQAIEAAMDALTAIDMIASEGNKSDLIDFNESKIDVTKYQKDNNNNNNNSNNNNKDFGKTSRKNDGDQYRSVNADLAFQTFNTKINGISMEDLHEPAQNQKISGSSSPLSISNLSSSSACVTDPLSISNLSAGMSTSFNSGITTTLPYAIISNTNDLSSNVGTNTTIIQSMEQKKSCTKGKDSHKSQESVENLKNLLQNTNKSLSKREQTQDNARIDQIKKSLSSMGRQSLIEATPRGYISSGVKNSLLLSDLQSCPNPLLRDLAAANPKLMALGKGRDNNKVSKTCNATKPSKTKDSKGLPIKKRESHTTNSNNSTKGISLVEREKLSASGAKPFRMHVTHTQDTKDKKQTNNTRGDYPKVKSVEKEVNIKRHPVESTISGVVPSMIRTISTNPNKVKMGVNHTKIDETSTMAEMEKKNLFEASVNSNHSFESSSSLTSLSVAFSENKIVNNSSENFVNMKKNKDNQHSLFIKEPKEKKDTQIRNLSTRKAQLCNKPNNNFTSNNLFSPTYPFKSSMENSILKSLNVFDHEELSCQDVKLLNRVSGGEIMEIPNNRVELEVYNSDLDTDTEAFKSSSDDLNSSSLNIEDLKNGDHMIHHRKDNIMPLLDETDDHRFQYLNEQQMLHYTYPMVHGNLPTPNTFYGKEDENRNNLTHEAEKYFEMSINKSDIVSKLQFKENENRVHMQKGTQRDAMVKSNNIVTNENIDSIEDSTSVKNKRYDSSHVSSPSRNDNDKGLLNTDYSMKPWNIFGNDLNLNVNANGVSADEDLFFMQ